MESWCRSVPALFFRGTDITTSTAKQEERAGRK
jgi:hypothetical protein